MRDDIRSYLLNDHLRYPAFPFHIQPARHNRDFHLHRHDFTELTFVVEGRGTHLVNGHTYPISQGNVFSVHPGLVHGFAGADNLRIINMMFSWENPLTDNRSMTCLPGFHHLFTLEPMLRESGSYKEGLSLKGEKWDRIMDMTYTILDEYAKGDGGYAGMIRGAFEMLIITLSRDGAGTGVSSPEETDPVARAMAYLQKNYPNRITAEELAEAACVSSRHLARMFNNLLNMTPFEYLADLRLKEAHGKLTRSVLSITEIAADCGFSDSNYFSQVFKKRYGMSPREYRKGP